jgi:phage/plasmid-associated DNA primase
MDYLENYSKAGIITHSIQKEGKAPVWYKDGGKKDLTYKDKKENIETRIAAYNTSEHDPKRIGFFAGEQADGRFIISLDFDIYDKEGHSEYAEKQFEKIKKMLNKISAFQFFETSTCGNYGALIDITECEELIKLIKSIKDNDGKEREKYSYNGLEVFVNGSNVVLPPTITKCKRHNKECKGRTFYSVRYNEYKKETNEYTSSKLILKDINPSEKDDFTKWLTDFINLVCKPKKEVIETKPKETKTTKATKEVESDNEDNDNDNKLILNKLIEKEKKKKENIEKKKKETKEKTQKLKETLANKLLEKDDINDKMLRKLLDCMSDKRFNEYNEWFKLTTIVKNAFGEDYYDTFDEYNQKYKGYDKEKNKQIWNNIKLEKYNIGYLVYLAKEDNPEKYKEYQKIFNSDILINEKTIADYIHLYNNNFIVQDGILYYFNNRIWIFGKEAENYMKGYISNDLYMFLLSDILIHYAQSRDYPELVKNLQKYCMTTKQKESIIKTLFEKRQNYTASNKIIFDKEEEIFMFNDGCYDLKQKKFIYCNKDNSDFFRSLYVTIDCGYSYEKANVKDIKFMNELLDKIFLYNKQHKNKFLEIVSTGLTAKLNQQMHIFNGNGGNGKSLILEYVKATLGSYFCTGQVELILTNSKATSDAKALLHNKRLCSFSEPDSNEKINNSYMKAITGESKIIGKNLYETAVEKNNTNTFVLLTNELPEFKTSVTNGEIRRLDVVNFKATFTNNVALVDNKTIFLADTNLSNTDKQQQYKFALFQLLVEAYQNYKNRNYTYEVIQEFEISKQKYINKSETTLTNIFNLIEEADDKTYIKLKDLYARIKESESYDLMTVREKKKFTKENLIEYMEKNILFKKNFIVVDKVKCLMNHQFKLPEEEDYDDKLEEYQEEVDRIKRYNFKH